MSRAFANKKKLGHLFRSGHSGVALWTASAVAVGTAGPACQAAGLALRGRLPANGLQGRHGRLHVSAYVSMYMSVYVICYMKSADPPGHRRVEDLFGCCEASILGGECEGGDAGEPGSHSHVARINSQQQDPRC